MTTNREMFADLLAPGLRKIFFDDYNNRLSEWERIFNVETTNRKYEDDYQMGGLGKMPQKAEGQSITYDDPLSGKTLRYIPLSWGLGFRVTYEAYKDDLYGVLGKRMTMQLSKAAKWAQEVHAWGVLNDGFADSGLASGTTRCNTFDGISLFNVAHTRLDGGSQANRSSTDADLSISSLQAGIDLFEGWTDERGMPMICQPKLLVIPYQSKWVAKEILHSDGKPYTAGNEINALKDEGLDFMVSHWLTDSTNDSWFLLADKSEHSLNWFWREKPIVSSADDFDTGDAKNKCYQRFIAGVSNWVGCFGSQGA